MFKENINPQILAALSETFKNYGWDPEVLDIVSCWTEFECTERGFTAEEIAEDGRTTRVIVKAPEGRDADGRLVGGYARVEWVRDGKPVVNELQNVDRVIFRYHSWVPRIEGGLTILAPSGEPWIITSRGDVLIRGKES